MSVKHVDKGLDLLVDISAIDKWSYQIPTNTYTVYGNLRKVDGINHKIYNADTLSKLDASDLYARILIDFQAMKEDEVRRYENTQDERYWNIKEKLEKLNERVARYGVDDFDSREEERKWKRNRDLVIKIYTSFFETGKITKLSLNFANKLWKKYK